MLSDLSHFPMIEREQTLTPQEKVEWAIMRRVGNRVRNLRVSFSGDCLLLTGNVETYHAKQVVKHATMELVDMCVIDDGIEVDA